MKNKQKYMVCQECGEIDETRTAYCIRCGRSLHKLMTAEEIKKEYPEKVIQ